MSDRKCGSCSACCTLQGVLAAPPVLPERKPPCTTCVHVRPQGGCGVYADRPAECQSYRCLWLDGLGGQADRPDRIRALFEPQGERVIGRMGAERVERSPRVRALVTFMRRRGVEVALLPWGVARRFAHLNHPMCHVDDDGVIVDIDEKDGVETPV